MKHNEEWVCEVCGKGKLEGIYKMWIEKKETFACYDCRRGLIR